MGTVGTSSREATWFVPEGARLLGSEPLGPRRLRAPVDYAALARWKFSEFNIHIDMRAAAKVARAAAAAQSNDEARDKARGRSKVSSPSQATWEVDAEADELHHRARTRRLIFSTSPTPYIY
jgi:hypothetical protein